MLRTVRGMLWKMMPFEAAGQRVLFRQWIQDKNNWGTRSDLLFEHKTTRRSRHPAPSSAEEDELYPRFRALATMTKLTTLILQQLHAVRVLRPLTPRTINRISCQCKCRCEVNVELFQTVGFILFLSWKSELSKWKTMCWHRVGGKFESPFTLPVWIQYHACIQT